MSKPIPCLGSRSWNACQVSLIIANTESLYILAQECLARTQGDAKKASRLMLRRIPARAHGCNFNPLCVREALEDLKA